ncbi:MAG: hypothetical protein UZ01_00871 [Candidatus Brocadia sinica]|nr:MAG: hypothetical protein UZ01_00871 [Candidatus Brocadia sinica]
MGVSGVVSPPLTPPRKVMAIVLQVSENAEQIMKNERRRAEAYNGLYHMRLRETLQTLRATLLYHAPTLLFILPRRKREGLRQL